MGLLAAPVPRHSELWSSVGLVAAGPLMFTHGVSKLAADTEDVVFDTKRCHDRLAQTVGPAPSSIPRCMVT